ncbi:hypothetical protein DDE82_002294 [Stemphylium lycopersici]|uniref:Uncharacterized protein n=1 Tax=Stemphylium lycopersici TaxID=183478 RepID=A0A364NGZ9_STELY|nr:hypothetical protein TW65_08223 [Stemphylium lycopersici]RAR08314.1 hypothetical protein DDE82_002294 [Stemphylium lycopersici]RAR16383.1 hypothetical protein DDE83_000256 [Stemphylium lycopersici]
MATFKRASPPLGSQDHPLNRNSIDESAIPEEENSNAPGPTLSPRFPRGTPLSHRYCSMCPIWDIRRESKGTGTVESSQQQQDEGSTSESSTIRADDGRVHVNEATSTKKKPCQHVDEKHPSLLDENTEGMHDGDSHPSASTVRSRPAASTGTLHAHLPGPDDPATRRQQILDRFFS